MFDRVLVVVDECDAARDAVATAFTLAEPFGGTVEVVFVRPEESATTEAERAVFDEVARREDASELTVETHTQHGEPTDLLADRTEDRTVDLVVVGWRDRDGLGKWLLGDLTQRAIEATDVPVLSVPAGADASDLTDVLVPTGRTATAVPPYAGAIARAHDATLHAVTVVDLRTDAGLFDAGGATEDELDRFEDQGRERLDDLVAELSDDLDIAREVIVGPEPPHEPLEGYADDHDVDLVVMETTGAPGPVDRLLGSVTDKLLTATDLPVLVVTREEE